MQIQWMDIEELVPYEANARTHSEEQVQQIAESIRRLGFNDPVAVDGERGIIEGHGRVLAARQLGLEQVPAIELSHLSEDEKRAYILAHNKLTERGGWDPETLAAELERLQAVELEELAGFGAEEIEGYLQEPEILWDDEAEGSKSGGHSPTSSVSFWVFDHKITDSRDETYQWIQEALPRIRNMDDERVASAIMEGLRAILD